MKESGRLDYSKENSQLDGQRKNIWVSEERKSPNIARGNLVGGGGEESLRIPSGRVGKTYDTETIW